MRIFLTRSIVCITMFSIAAFGAKDREGREIVYGPIFANQPIYSNIHVISESYGFIAKGPVQISNVVIEAPVCVQSSGYGLRLNNSALYCKLGVEFTGNALMNNDISYNKVAGQLSNRPDVF